MNPTPGADSTRSPRAIGPLAFALGGLAPFATGVGGFWTYAAEGRFLTRTGAPFPTVLGAAICFVFVVAGLAMMVFGGAAWRRRRTASRADPHS